MRLSILLPTLALLFCFQSCKKPDEPQKTEIPAFADNQDITLPVIFHIVHGGEAVGTGGNFAADSVVRMLDYLNRSFAGEFSGIDAHIRFRLAVKGPTGNTLAEPGVDRVNTGTSQYDFADFQDNDTLGRSWEWNPSQYLNVSFINVPVTTTSLTVGFSYFPYSNPDYPVAGLSEARNPDWNSSIYRNGIFLRTDFLLAQGPRAYSVLTHEMGHQFGLFHIFSTEGCADANDYCNDTHDYDRSHEPSTLSRTGCDGVTYTADNYMDYGPVVYKVFTADQIARMRRVANFSPWRGALYQSQMRGTGPGQPAPKPVRVD